MNALTVSDLPTPRPNTPLPGGATLETRQPVLFCPSCHQTWSANPGDYFMRPKGEVFGCDDCDGTLLELRDPIGPFYAPFGRADEIAQMVRWAINGAREDGQ